MSESHTESGELISSLPAMEAALAAGDHARALDLYRLERKWRERAEMQARVYEHQLGVLSGTLQRLTAGIAPAKHRDTIDRDPEDDKEFAKGLRKARQAEDAPQAISADDFDI